MLASDVLTLGAAIFGLLTSVAGSSACFYNTFRTSKMNLSILKVKVHNLENLINGLQQKMNGIDVLMPDPSPWIDHAKEFLSKVNIRSLETHLNESCCHGRVPNVCSRYGAGRSIEEKIEALDVLLENGRRISQETKVKGCKQPEVNMVGSAREEITQKIWDQVSDGGAPGSLCIYGIAGVGKTAMAVAIHNRAMTERMSFDIVIWVSVEHGSGLRHVQEEIARKLSVDLSSATDNAERARTLRTALKEMGKFLLVLDSMWQAFSFHDIGIPELAGGSKVILTSRNHSICRKITRKVTSSFYEIKPLSDVDAWELFQNEVGPNILHLESETLRKAELAVNKLNGIPLAIKLLAEILSEIHDEFSHRTNATWREELDALERSALFLGNRSQDLFDCFKCSHENLGENAFSCFIYCTLFPEGLVIKAKELMEYWMWEGLLGEISSLEESLRQGKKILNELRDAHLLDQVNDEAGEESVTMLNIVRHVAMDANVKSGTQFYIKCGNSLSQLPLENDWPLNTERASFVKNQLKLLENGPDCKTLSTLLLQDNPLDLNHRDNFFTKIRNIGVLDLSRTSISSLPKSFSGLTNLRALLLRDCTSLKLLPSLSKLSRLIVIDLCRTPLEHLPEGLQSLTNLRRLDLSQTKLQVLPNKVVGKLLQLEELFLITDHNSGYMWRSNQIYPQWAGACVEELLSMRRLSNLQLGFLNAKVFNKYVGQIQEQRSSLPHRFRFCVGGSYTDANVGDNSIAVIGDHNIRLPQMTCELYLAICVEKITSLKFDGCLRDLAIVDISKFDELTYLFTLEMLGNLRNLKKICVKQCNKLVSIVQPAAEANPTSITLPAELMTFVLFNLPEFKCICDVEVLNSPSLRGIEVWSCDILSLPMVLLGRSNGIIEIKGEKQWLDKVKMDCPTSNSTLRFHEVSVPTELSSTPRIRRLKSSLESDNAKPSSSKSFGFPSIPLLRPLSREGETRVQAKDDIGTLGRIARMVKAGLAFSNSAGSLHISSCPYDDISEESASKHSVLAMTELSQRGFTRAESSRSDS